MKKMKLISLRKCNQQFYNTVMYEWEDDFATKGVEIIYRNRLYKLFAILIQKYLRLPYRIRQIKKNSIFHNWNDNKFAFLMFSSQYKEYFPENVIPIFIDTRVKSYDFLVNAIKNIDIAIITNRNAYERAKEIYPEKKLYSIPLWCSNKWHLNEVPQKTIDILQIGRKNDILHNYMLKYTSLNPQVEYIYQEDNSKQYISTIRGNIGLLKTREEYMMALRHAKICLVSSPLVDSDSDMDFITPRVYEAAMSYCYMIGRFTQNQEFFEIELNKVVDIVHDYETFDFYITKYLKTKDFVKKFDFDNFINKNSFDNRWKKISNMINLQY